MIGPRAHNKRDSEEKITNNCSRALPGIATKNAIWGENKWAGEKTQETLSLKAQNCVRNFWSSLRVNKNPNHPKPGKKNHLKIYVRSEWMKECDETPLPHQPNSKYVC